MIIENSNKGLEKEVDLKLDFSNLSTISRRLRKMPESRRERIVKKAYKINPSKYEAPIKKIVMDLFYNRDFCEVAGINYNNINGLDISLMYDAINYSIARSINKEKSAENKTVEVLIG